MKIRSITVFCQPSFPPNRLLLQQQSIGWEAGLAKNGDGTNFHSLILRKY